MAISSEMKRWLREAGFTNYCFISYPHVAGSQMTEFAHKVKGAIEEELKYEVSNPGVFLDTTNIPPGAEWPEHLRLNLCCSVAMVAILAPIYLEEEHDWCGREWAAMASLGRARLQDNPIQPIIPVMFRKTQLPLEAGSRQSIDLSRISLKGRRYYASQEFRSAILKIVAQIVDIAARIKANSCRVDVAGFEFPQRSPFSTTPLQPPPLRDN